jgi:twitching motility protein PilT
MVNQREVRVDTDDFTIAMGAAMRQDPDVILVGEIRDAETLKTSLAAAETVLSTLHTADAAETVNRCIDLFPSYQQRQGRLSLATALRGIVDQYLIALYRDGVIELEDALGVASNPHDLQVALRNQGLVA